MRGYSGRGFIPQTRDYSKGSSDSTALRRPKPLRSSPICYRLLSDGVLNGIGSIAWYRCGSASMLGFGPSPDMLVVEIRLMPSWQLPAKQPQSPPALSLCTPALQPSTLQLQPSSPPALQPSSPPALQPALSSAPALQPSSHSTLLLLLLFASCADAVAAASSSPPPPSPLLPPVLPLLLSATASAAAASSAGLPPPLLLLLFLCSFCLLHCFCGCRLPLRLLQLYCLLHYSSSSAASTSCTASAVVCHCLFCCPAASLLLLLLGFCLSNSSIVSAVVCHCRFCCCCCLLYCCCCLLCCCGLFVLPPLSLLFVWSIVMLLPPLPLPPLLLGWRPMSAPVKKSVAAPHSQGSAQQTACFFEQAYDYPPPCLSVLTSCCSYLW